MPQIVPVPQMPMDKFWIPFLATLVLLHQTTSASDPKDLIRAVGESVTFRTHDMTGENAFWRFGNDPIVVASFEDPPQALFSTNKFTKRFAVSEKGRALSVSHLTLQDSGIYFATIGGKTFTFTLHVYNKLAEPTVTCEAQNCSGGSCHFFLRCSTSGTGLGQVSYTWRVGDRPWDEGSTVLWVNKFSSSEEPLTCTAQNPVSSRKVTVTTPNVLCTGALSSSRFMIMLIAGVGVKVLLSALLVLLLHFCKSREATSTTLYTKVGPSQQYVSNGIKAKPLGGNCSKTIYSLVKHPDQVDGGTAENAPMTRLELV
ncbi:PREDICTED: SLAM family member 7-like isoform X2 [Sturnus vulgaris]|uniref:SLAM family member 7-like isoform X2 n=1 Tax=Sturnus vulgaris TaxID=9172 RepID=UPI00071A3D13|nr:PREDICTED: SLAM family member 7-like isoform X2 [Sturnus vulgaris]